MKYVPPAVPHVLPQNRWHRLVWLLPVLALVWGLFTLIRAQLDTGPEITITFHSAAGLAAGQTPVKYKDVTIGVVQNITLSKDDASVLVSVRIDKNAENILRTDSRFWVVRPRIGMNGVSGIDTLISGAYIEADKGYHPQPATRFTGLETPPAVIHDTPGSQILIDAQDLGSLDIGSPVYFRRIQVGRIASYHLKEDGSGITLTAFVDAPYDHLLTPDTRFWNVSGLDLSVGANGFRLKTETVAAIMAGGIAFANPPPAPEGAQTAPATHYVLAADQDAAMASPDGPAIRFRLRFNQSLRGLTVGAPVEFSSVQIGRVSSLELDYNPTGYRFPTLVNIDVYPSRLGHVLSRLPGRTSDDLQSDAALFTRELVANGLRARAVPGNLLTGQLYISLDFIADAPRVPFNLQARPIELPTINGGLDKIQEQIAGIVTKVNQMPLVSIGRHLDGTLAGLDRTLTLVNSQTLPSVNKLTGQALKTTQTVGDLLADDSPVMVSLLQTLQQANGTLRAVRLFTDQLSRSPAALLKGRQEEIPPEIPSATSHGRKENYP